MLNIRKCGCRCLFIFVICFMLSVLCVNKCEVLANKIIESYCDVLSGNNVECQAAFANICKEAGIELGEGSSASDILNFVKSTQDKFVNRKNGKERWESTDLIWINEKNRNNIYNNMLTLGFFNKVSPKNSKYDAICILGATIPAMENRLKYAEELVNEGVHARYIVLLTGERYLKVNVDCNDEGLSELSLRFNTPKDRLTETQAFEYLYMKSKLKDKFKLIIIDTPQKNGMRPTTQTTVEEFLNSKNSDISSALFVSSQPSVKYQEAVINEVLVNRKSNLKFETVGNVYKNFNLQRAISELGSLIFAYTPQVIRKAKIRISKDDTKDLKELFFSNSLIYNNLASLVTG